MIFLVLLAHPHPSSVDKSRSGHPTEPFRTMFQPSSTICWLCDLAGLTLLSPRSREGALGWSNDDGCYFWMPLRKTRNYLYFPGNLFEEGGIFKLYNPGMSSRREIFSIFIIYAHSFQLLRHVCYSVISEQSLPMPLLRGTRLCRNDRKCGENCLPTSAKPDLH